MADTSVIVDIAKRKNWKRFKKEDLKIGDLVKGFTYSVGDFHDASKTDTNVSKKSLGDAKLRVGVVIDCLDHEYFKVQFRNSWAESHPDSKFVNNIDVLDKKTKKKLTTINGRDSYCIWLNKHSLRYKLNNETVAHFSPTDIYSKHSWEKKNVEEHWIKNRKILDSSKDEINWILKNKQFRPEELTLTDDRAKLKLSYILTRHRGNGACVEKELQKFNWLCSNFPNLVDWNNLDGKASIDIKSEMIQEEIMTILKRTKSVNRSTAIAHYCRSSGMSEKYVKTIYTLYNMFETSNHNFQIAGLLSDFMTIEEKYQITKIGKDVDVQAELRSRGASDKEINRINDIFNKVVHLLGSIDEEFKKYAIEHEKKNDKQ